MATFKEVYLNNERVCIFAVFFNLNLNKGCLRTLTSIIGSSYCFY